MQESVYDRWNEVKKEISKQEKYITFKIREIYWLKIGENIGYKNKVKKPYGVLILSPYKVRGFLLGRLG